MITPCAVAGRLAARASSGVSGASDRPSAFCGATGGAVALSGVAPPPPLSFASCSSVGRSPTVTVTVWRLPPRMMSSGTRDPTGVLATR